jgi:hypothetical protein
MKFQYPNLPRTAQHLKSLPARLAIREISKYLSMPESIRHPCLLEYACSLLFKTITSKATERSSCSLTSVCTTLSGTHFVAGLLKDGSVSAPSPPGGGISPSPNTWTYRTFSTIQWRSDKQHYKKHTAATPSALSCMPLPISNGVEITAFRCESAEILGMQIFASWAFHKQILCIKAKILHWLKIRKTFSTQYSLRNVLI